MYLNLAFVHSGVWVFFFVFFSYSFLFSRGWIECYTIYVVYGSKILQFCLLSFLSSSFPIPRYYLFALLVREDIVPLLLLLLDSCSGS